MRVLTLNVWGRSGAWKERRAVITQGLHQLAPDLIAFQEPVVSDTYDQVADLLGADYFVAHATRGLVPGAGHQGASIASRWPIAAVHEVDLHLTPRTADFPCTTLVVQVTVPEPVGSTLFVNHLPSWQPSFELERELQAVAAARFIEKLVAETADPHVVLAGDFSAGPDAADVRFWSGRQSLGGMSVCYRDGWESSHPDEAGFTKSPRNPLAVAGVWPQRRIDYILVRCPERGGGPTLSIKRCDLAFDHPVAGVWASDHFGVVADLEAFEEAKRSHGSRARTGRS